DSSGTDNTPPQINLSVTAGDSGEQSPILIAELFDANGINLSTWEDHDPMVFIDGNMQDTLHVGDFFYYSPESFQNGTLRYPLPYLSSGGHTLTLKVHDTYNNPASETISFVVDIKTPPEQIPDRITLLQNYPNPFNSETTIPFVLSGSRRFRVRMEIYNILGQRVRSLLNTVLPGGEHSVRWDGRNDGGNPVASGVYIYRLRVSSAAVKGNGAARGGVYQFSRKMVLLR
ncbi:MAG: T9SS C-terminal target domain-containing protein, partial [Calditrichaeota bacterium]